MEACLGDCAMSFRINAFDRFLENMDLRDTDLTYRRSNKFGNNCERCGRIRRSKKCECEMNREARMIARGFG